MGLVGIILAIVLIFNGRRGYAAREMLQQGPWSNGVTMTLEGYLPLYLHVLAAALLAAAFLRRYGSYEVYQRCQRFVGAYFRRLLPTEEFGG